MSFLTSSILSGVIYDGFKKGVKITSDFLKDKLQGWLLDDVQLNKLAEQVNSLNLEDFGEHIIERKLNESTEIQQILKQIKPEQNTTIDSVKQTHYGSGDNFVGNKTVYHK